MSDRRRLEELCRHIDGRPYPAWKELLGEWRLDDDLLLLVDHVQGDPYAAPSRVRLRLPGGLPPELLSDEAGRVAVADWLLRSFGRLLRRLSDRRGASGPAGFSIYRPGPEVVARSAVRVDARGTVEARFEASLPARGRRVLGRQGLGMLLSDLPKAAEALRVGGEPPAELSAHVASVRRQRQLRDQLEARGLVAFLADGSVLPRDSGVSTGPLAQAVPLQAPDSLRVELQTDQGPVAGLGIPRGITVVTGGGFHGKSTLLQALQWGHLDHVPGDGREAVVCLPDAVKVRAEDGRSVQSVDISAFLSELPGGRDTRAFSTADASGSTSQAAAVVEAVEAGARLLLLDEDTSATNLLVRDARMRQLVPREREPITPLVERMRQLRDDWGVSVVIVVGGVGDFLAVADTVVGMDAWRPVDLTEAAHRVGGAAPTPPGPLPPVRARTLRPGCLAPERHRVRARSRRQLDHGGEEIDLVAVEQVLDAAHARSLGQALRVLDRLHGEGPATVPALLDRLDALLRDGGPEVLSPWDAPPGDLVAPRRHEVAAALNRLRTLEAELPRG